MSKVIKIEISEVAEGNLFSPGFNVQFEGRIASGLTFDEMLGQIISICYPVLRGRSPEPFYRMMYPWELRRWNRIYCGIGDPYLITERSVA